MLFSSLFLQATPAPSGGGFGNTSLLIMFGLMFLVMYFFNIRPQQKRAREQKNFRETLKKGDRVVTTGGLHGRIVEIDDETVTLDVDRGTRLTFERTGISVEFTRKVQKSTETK